MSAVRRIVYWRGEKFCVGRWVDHPEVMSQGETIDELKENLRDVCRGLLPCDVPSDCRVADIALRHGADSLAG